MYEVLNVKLTHGIEFHYFFDLLLTVSETLGLNVKNKSEQDQSGSNLDIDDEEYSDVSQYLHVDVLDIFCKNFIRGFSKLIVDLGFDNFILDELKID